MSITPSINQEIINVGTSPNDQSGDPLRTAFIKVNNNFANLFSTFLNSTVAYTTGNTAGQVIFEYPVDEFTEGQFYIKSIDTNSGNSLAIQLFAQVNNNSVKFSGYGTTFFGDPVTNYDMAVTSGNVTILASPLTSADQTHFISSQIMWAGPNVPGMALAPDGYVDSSLATESIVDITTEQS